jgi:hypothetical protein
MAMIGVNKDITGQYAIKDGLILSDDQNNANVQQVTNKISSTAFYSDLMNKIVGLSKEISETYPANLRNRLDSRLTALKDFAIVQEMALSEKTWAFNYQARVLHEGLKLHGK